MNHADRILIVGASGRAAAFSALRAGIEPRCVDHFADRDLVAACPVDRVPIEEGPAGLERVALAACRQVPGSTPGRSRITPTWWSGSRRTIACSATRPRCFARCATPSGWPRCCAGTGCRCAGGPARSPEGLPRDGTWLVKPLASGGGRSIQIPGPTTGQPPSEPCYFQRLVAGPSFSALFTARLGASRAHRRDPAAHRSAGIALRLSRQHRALARCPSRSWLGFGRSGQVLASAFALVGLFGVDYILHDDEPWPVEVNPRYTASVEVLELALGRSLLAEHICACLRQPRRLTGPTRSGISRRRLPALSARRSSMPTGASLLPTSPSIDSAIATRSRFPPSPMSPGREPGSRRASRS